MPPAGCNTAITPIGKRCASIARRIGWPSSSRRCRKFAQRFDAPFGRRADTRIRVVGGDRIDRAHRDPAGQRRSYARLNGTRGATTLLKSNVILEEDSVVLTFKAKLARR